MNLEAVARAVTGTCPTSAREGPDRLLGASMWYNWRGFYRRARLSCARLSDRCRFDA